MRYQNTESQSGAKKILEKVRNVPTVGVVYRGKVIDNQDPSNTGRVKIRIPALYSSLSDEDTPWALPCLNMASYNSGSFIIPQINDNVWVVFENNDIFKPVYIGSMYTTESTMPSKAGSSIAPPYQNHVPYEGLNPDHYVVMKTPGGSGMWMNDERGTAHMYSANGGIVDLEQDNVTVQFTTGGSLISTENRVQLVSPDEGRVDVDDDGPFGPAIYITRSGFNKMSFIDGVGIDLEFSEGAKHKIKLDKKVMRLSRNDEEQTITLKDGAIQIDHKDNKVLVEDDKITILHKGGNYVMLTDNNIILKGSGEYINMSNGVIDIEADSKIHLKAPSIRIEGDVECDGC